MIGATELLESVAADTGLDDYGDPSFREGLSRLLWSAEHEAELNDIGALAAEAMIRGHLRNRLRIEDWHRSHPEIDHEVVDRPVFLVGMARSGTTALSQLLGVDPRWRSLLGWEANDSVPPPETATYDDDPRFVAARESADGMALINPDFKAIHHDPPDAPIECVVVYCQAFVSLLYPTVYHLPSYADWVIHTDHSFAVAYHQRSLRLLQSRHPGRWQLKTPQHALALDDLRATHPDATFVVTHRDPAVCTASTASLLSSLGGSFTEVERPLENGTDAVRIIGSLADGLVRHATERGPDQFVHIDYEDLRSDRIGVARRLYDQLDVELTPEVEQSMRAHVEASPQGKHGVHRYDMADYGLTPEALDERFATYKETFDVPDEIGGD